jgi:outer membrane protein assembly factor BamB
VTWKRAALAVVAVLLLLAGAVAVYAYHRYQASQDVHGSSSVEFVTSAPVHHRAPRDPIRWPMYGYDEQRTRFDPDTTLSPPYRAVWTYKAKRLLEFPPVLGYRYIFTTTNDGRLLALNRRFGTVSWVGKYGRCSAASPAVDGYSVFAAFLGHAPCYASKDGLLAALRVRDGKERWRVHIGPSETSPLIADGRVYVGDWNGNVWAFDEKSGRLDWKYTTGGAVKGGVAYDAGRVFVGSYDHNVYCLDAKTGKLIWRAGAQERLGATGNFYASPAVGHGRVYIGATDGKVYSFGEQSGKLRWSHGTGSYVYSSPALWKDLVLVGSHDQNFYALNAATGDVVWKFPAGGKISGSAVVANGVVYVSTLSHQTFALDAATGKRLWTWNDGAYAGVIFGRERVYLTGVTRLYALIELPRKPTK